MIIIIFSKWLNSSIWLIDCTPPDTTHLDQNELRSKSNEEYSTLSKVPGLEPHHQMVFSVIPTTQTGAEFLPFCRGKKNHRF